MPRVFTIIALPDPWGRSILKILKQIQQVSEEIMTRHWIYTDVKIDFFLGNAVNGEAIKKALLLRYESDTGTTCTFIFLAILSFYMSCYLCKT